MNTTSSTQKEEGLQHEPGVEGAYQNNKVYGNVQADERSEITQERIPIEGTIFTKGWMKGKGWAIGLDDKRLTEWVETEEEINEKIEKGGLTLAEITRMMYILIEDNRVQQELKNNKN